MSHRKITPAERALVERLLSFRSAETGENPFPIEGLVEEIDAEGSLKFAHSVNAGRFEQRKFPVEGHAKDLDGILIHALLFIVDGKLDELEIYKDDSSPIKRMPEPQEWEILDLA